MKEETNYLKCKCKFCGSTSKLVETIIDDEFAWNDTENCFEPIGFSDDFEHTGTERCANCKNEWTGTQEETTISSQ